MVVHDGVSGQHTVQHSSYSTDSYSYSYSYSYSCSCSYSYSYSYSFICMKSEQHCAGLPTGRLSEHVSTLAN